MADFTLTPGPFPVGTTVGVYRRQTVIDERGPKGSVLTTGTTASTLTTPLTGLSYDTEYWAAAQVDFVWRKVQFRTDPSPDSDLTVLQAALEAEAADRASGDADEAEARANAISAEATARASADTALGARTDSLESSSAVKAPATVLQHVEGVTGDDANDGRSWGTAKASIASAIAVLPDGGPVFVASGDPYNVTTSLALAGHDIQSFVRAPGGTKGLAVLRHRFNGNLVNIGSKGAHLRNLLLYEDDAVTGRTGAAIVGTSISGAGGTLLVENCEISGGDGWERCVILDGTAWAVSGIRKCEFLNLHCFGARIAGETIVITRGVYCTFLGGFIVPAPTAVTQGIKVLDTGSTSVKFIGFSMIGDFYTEAAGDPLGVLYVGDISGNVVCSSSARRNVFIGTIGGTFDNGGNASNYVIGTVGGNRYENRTNTWTALQNHEAAISGAAAATNGAKRLLVTGGAAGALGAAEVYDRMSISGNHVAGNFPLPDAGGLYIDGTLYIAGGLDTPVTRAAAGKVNLGKLAVGNSAAATTPGSVVKKIEVFDATGASLGFIPVYSTIT